MLFRTFPTHKDLDGTLSANWLRQSAPNSTSRLGTGPHPPYWPRIKHSEAIPRLPTAFPQPRPPPLYQQNKPWALWKASAETGMAEDCPTAAQAAPWAKPELERGELISGSRQLWFMKQAPSLLQTYNSKSSSSCIAACFSTVPAKITIFSFENKSALLARRAPLKRQWKLSHLYRLNTICLPSLL